MSMSDERINHGPIRIAHSLSEEAEPLMHISFCPGNALLVRFLGSFTQYPLSALTGRHDDRDLISLTRPSVNTPYLAMKAECVAL